MSQETDNVLRLLEQHEAQIISEWQQEAGLSAGRLTDAARRGMQSEAEEILRGLRSGLKAGADPEAFQTAAWDGVVGSSRVDLQACKLEYSIVSPK